MVRPPEGRVIRPLGPEGVQQRMQELQSRLDQVLGRQFEQTLSEVTPISGTLRQGGFAPFDPLGAGTLWKGLEAPSEWKGKIRDAAARQGLDPDLFDALVEAESAYDPNARSRAGALGLTQLMPGTAASLGVDPLDPDQNLDGGARYLAQLLRRFGDAKTALAAYNAGPGAVDRAGGIPPYGETRAYVDKVMQLYNQRKNR